MQDFLFPLEITHPFPQEEEQGKKHRRLMPDLDLLKTPLCVCVGGGEFNMHTGLCLINFTQLVFDKLTCPFLF